MRKKFKHLFFALLIIPSILIGGYFTYVEAASISSTNFNVLNPIISNGLGSVSSLNFGLGSSIGQVVIGKSASSNFQLWSGYQYFTQPVQFTLLGSSVSNTTGAVSLQWTTPTIRNGAPITGYEVGIGSNPYLFTFQSVGNVSSFVKTGLTNGTTYYFIVKAITTGSLPLAFSGSVRVIPSGTTAVTPPGGGGGGGGGTTVSGGAVEVSGMAYPNTKVTLIKDGSIVSTTVADPGATFRMNVSNLPSGNYVFGVYADDTNGFKSPTYSFPVTVTNNVTVTINNIFLAPTIGVDSSQVKQGDPIGIFGTTAPNAEVTLHVHSLQDFTNKVTASSVGKWFKQFDTSVLELGSHITYSRSARNDQITDQSNTVSFTVGDTTIKNDQKYKRSDLNNDGKVNIVDFSMLLYYWRKKPPATSKADIDKSGIVDIKDLSIMLYDWTG